ncbi:hypothetical protein F4805DRAFT_173837 [Annulohypoxylon moriforme]|nr:hypothetical protein F4805DRAFT_173837 [Annulohypoxylon moriforme]
MEHVENFGLESRPRRHPSIRVVISKSNMYGSAQPTKAVPPVVVSMNPAIADVWSGDGPIGLAAMGVETPRHSQDKLGNHVEIATKGKKDKDNNKKGLWSRLKKKFKRDKSPGPHPWRRVVSGGFGGILVGRETKVETEDTKPKPAGLSTGASSGFLSGLPRSRTTADFRRPRPISTNWKAAHDEHFDLGDERDKKPEGTVEKIEGLIRSASAILPSRH